MSKVNISEKYTKEQLQKLSVKELRSILGVIDIGNDDFPLNDYPCDTDIECCIACGFGNIDEPMPCDGACYCSAAGYCADGNTAVIPDYYDPPDPPETVRDSCAYRFEPLGTYGQLDPSMHLCDWDYSGNFPGQQDNPSWLCYFNATLGYGMYPFLFENSFYHAFDNWYHGLNVEDGTFGYYHRDEEFYVDSMPGCVVGALNDCIENCEDWWNGEEMISIEPVTKSFACTCNGSNVNDYARDIDYDWDTEDWIESFRWNPTLGMHDSIYLNQHLTANICVRNPGGTAERDSVYGKCTNGDPPYWVAADKRILQDHGGIPVYGYCCDDEAINYSGDLACGVAEVGNWVPLPSKSNEENIPAYYHYDDDGTIRTLQRYHVDEGRDSNKTCPTWNETHFQVYPDWFDCWNYGACGNINQQSRRDPLGVKQSSCFCKYMDDLGNSCFDYEMHTHYDGIKVCYPSEHTPQEVNTNRARLSRLGMSRTLSDLDLQDDSDSFRTGRHHISDFTKGWELDFLRDPSFSDSCDVTLSLSQCLGMGNCPDVSLNIQSVIDELEFSEEHITVCIPSGDYYIGESIYVNRSNITLRGESNTRLYFGLEKKDGWAQYGNMAGLRFQSGDIQREGTFDLKEPGLNGSNYIYVEDNDFLECGDTIEIRYSDGVESVIRENYNMSQLWGGLPGQLDAIKNPLFYRKITKAIKQENGMLRLTLDTPLRFGIPLSYGPFVTKITDGYNKNISLENIKVSSAMDFEIARRHNPDRRQIITFNKVEKSVIKNIESFSDTNFASYVYNTSNIDLVGDTETLPPPEGGMITQLMCATSKLNEGIPGDIMDLFNPDSDLTDDGSAAALEALLGYFGDYLGPTDNIPVQLKYYEGEEETILGVLERNDIKEASGLIHSRQYSNVFWTHNDSEGSNLNYIYAFNSNGDDLGRFTIGNYADGEPMFSIRDWEDMATDNEGNLYIAEIGDNNNSHDIKYIYECPEPDVNNPPENNEIGCNVFPFRYDDGFKYDAETLLVDTNGDIYIVTKSPFNFLGSEASKIFKLNTTTQIAEYVNDIGSTLEGEFVFLNQVTGGDISVDGTSVLIRTYEKIFKFDKSDFLSGGNATIEEMPYSRFPLELGEAVTWANDDNGYYTISEEGTMYDELINKLKPINPFIEALNEWLLDFSYCSENNYENTKNAFNMYMGELYFPNPSNVTNESRHLFSNGINLSNTYKVIVKDCTLKLPQRRGENANGYIFNISGNNQETLIEDCYGYRGRHNFLVAGLFNTSGLVFNRIKTEGGFTFLSDSIKDDDWWSRYQELEAPGLGTQGFSDSHIGLTQNFLVTDSDLLDGFSIKNRQTLSKSAGLTGANGIFWNVRGPETTGERWRNIAVPGAGVLESYQYGTGYIKNYDGNINLMSNVNRPYEYLQTASSVVTELITGEYVNPESIDVEGTATFGLIQDIFNKFAQTFIANFTSRVLDSTSNIEIDDFNIAEAGAPIACIYDIRLRNFECPGGNDNCSDMFSSYNTNVSYDKQTEELKIKMSGDEFRVDFGFYMQSQIGGPFDVCTFANTEFGQIGADNYSDAHISIANPFLEIILSPTESRVNIDSTSFNFYAEEWIFNLTSQILIELLEFFGMNDESELIDVLMNGAGIYDIFFGDPSQIPLLGINENIVSMITKPLSAELRSLIGTQEFNSLIDTIFSSIKDFDASEFTGLSDKVYGRELSSGIKHRGNIYFGENMNFIPTPTYGFDEIPEGYDGTLPNHNSTIQIEEYITNSNNLFEYQKNWGSWFGANEESIAIFNQLDFELPRNQLFEGIYQSPSILYWLDEYWFEYCPDTSGDILRPKPRTPLRVLPEDKNITSPD